VIFTSCLAFRSIVAGWYVQLRKAVRVSDLSETTRPPSRPPRRRRALGLATSAAAHALIFAAVATAWKNPPTSFEVQPIAVSLIQPPPPTPPPPPPKKPSTPRAPTHAEAAKPPAAHNIRVRQARNVPADVTPLAITPTHTDTPGDQLSEAQIAGASGGGEGGEGGSGHGCNMASRVQGALRKDQLVQAAISTLGGKAVMVWNGEWVQHDGQDGRGLAAVREAIMWEVAFAPPECRTEPVHGLVLLSMNGGGGTRLAVGSGEWRWSDLLGARNR
jgi:hypothetical protein